MFVEQTLTERLGDVGRKLHTARSRNDQVALDLRLYLLDEVKEIRALTFGLLAAITDQAERYKATVMPGYTHLQRAQPITFGHHLMAYAMMLRRDIGRLDDAAARMNVPHLARRHLRRVGRGADRLRPRLPCRTDRGCKAGKERLTTRRIGL